MFAYTVKDKSGKTINGVIDAPDEKTVASELRKQGYYIIEIEPVADNKNSTGKTNIFRDFVNYVINPIFAAVSVGDLAAYYRQFATMIKAGMTALDALDSLRRQTLNRVLRDASDYAFRHVERGGKISEALAEYPWVFRPLHIHLIMAGETGGKLDEMLDRLAAYVESQQKLHQRIKMSALYPCILILAVIFIPPIPKLVLGNFNEYFEATFGLILRLISIIFILWIIRLLSQYPRWNYIWGRIVLAIPMIGGITKSLALSEFYRSFSALYGAGLPITEALEYAADTTGNGYLSLKIKSGVPMLAAGESIDEVFKKIGIFPSMTIDMITVGAKTGDIDSVLEKMVEYTESAAQVSIHRLMTVVPILIFLAIAAYIGYYVVTTYVNMYTGILSQQ